MVNRMIFRHVVRRAVEICGNKKTLAVLLNVTVDQVNRWTDGRTAPPDHMLPRVMDILFDREQERLRNQKPKDSA